MDLAMFTRGRRLTLEIHQFPSGDMLALWIEGPRGGNYLDSMHVKIFGARGEFDALKIEGQPNAMKSYDSAKRRMIQKHDEAMMMDRAEQARAAGEADRVKADAVEAANET